MTGVNEIRSAFLDFFGDHGHTVVQSGPLVPGNDPSLMFTNAGMVQFKNVFTGQEGREYQRAVTAQKCVRAGGKHNDLENVGRTARHHTFFEMLGNFSFGDYFKERAISLAWELVTETFDLPMDRLLVTVFAEDDEAYVLWRRIAGLPEARIVRIPTSDNFWSMGDTGPCGPCSELFFDHGPEIAGGPPGSPEEDGDRFIEFWNLVFMQFEQQESGDRVTLPRPSIDTGMGLERIASILNRTHDNYRLDLLRGLIESVADLTNTDPDGDQSVSHRVIADHLRASSFLIADGVLPANEGRGYVLRRIMRRAMRHAHLLGADAPLMHRLVGTLAGSMGGHYGELVRARSLIEQTLLQEETRFRNTLERGLRLLEDEVARLGEGAVLPGDIAFKLYDTFGFPLDLTADVLRGQGRRVDTDGFERAMARQREEARRSWSGSGAAGTQTLWFELSARLAATEFLGYDHNAAEARVLALVQDGAEVDRLEVGQRGQLIVNQTPFYAQAGGQVGDTGTAHTEDGAVARICDTQRPHQGLIVHDVTVEWGVLRREATVQLRIDSDRRQAIRANHSATHLLHEALREAFGEHIAQKGSLVAPDRLRFDVSHNDPIDARTLREIEAAVNARVQENAPVETRVMALQEAIEGGARALFGEKYSEDVRVVSMGEAKGNRYAYSVELCGGTHVRRTGDIGLFRILSEGAVAAGVRRIEAATGAHALAASQEERAILEQCAAVLRTSTGELPQRLEMLVRERRDFERELTTLRRKLASAGQIQAIQPDTIGTISFLARVLDNVPAKDLKAVADEMKGQVGDGVALVISRIEGKASVVVGVYGAAKDLVDAVSLVRVAATALGGKGGGGRPDMAQAGGPTPAAADEAVAAVRRALEALER